MPAIVFCKYVVTSNPSSNQVKAAPDPASLPARRHLKHTTPTQLLTPHLELLLSSYSVTFSTPTMDPEISNLASDCLQSFVGLNKELDTRPSALMPREAMEDECGRFRIWCGNMGALQQSFASLDYRLREAPVMLSSVCRLLQQLRSNLAESKRYSSARVIVFIPRTFSSVPDTVDIRSPRSPCIRHLCCVRVATSL